MIKQKITSKRNLYRKTDSHVLEVVIYFMFSPRHFMKGYMSVTEFEIRNYETLFVRFMTTLKLRDIWVTERSKSLNAGCKTDVGRRKIRRKKKTLVLYRRQYTTIYHNERRKLRSLKKTDIILNCFYNL